MSQRHVPTTFFALLTVFASTLAAQEPPTTAPPPPAAPQPVPCSTREYRQFDFWLGTWEVRTPDGKIAGRNTIEPILGGCALHESWESASGSNGRSFNMYDAAGGQWHQTWVADNGTYLQLAGGLDEQGRMVLRGEVPRRDGSGVNLHEIAWTHEKDGSVRQHWRMSRDGGETWQDAFVGIYRKVGPPGH